LPFLQKHKEEDTETYIHTHTNTTSSSVASFMFHHNNFTIIHFGDIL